MSIAQNKDPLNNYWKIKRSYFSVPYGLGSWAQIKTKDIALYVYALQLLKILHIWRDLFNLQSLRLISLVQMERILKQGLNQKYPTDTFTESNTKRTMKGKKNDLLSNKVFTMCGPKNKVLKEKELEVAIQCFQRNQRDKEDRMLFVCSHCLCILSLPKFPESKLS